MQRYRVTGDVSPAQFGGFKKSALLEHERDICECIAADPDLTIAAIGDGLAERGTTTSRTAICRYLQKLGLTRKNIIRAIQQIREDVAKTRDDWRDRQRKLKLERLVFVDEI